MHPKEHNSAFNRKSLKTWIDTKNQEHIGGTIHGYYGGRIQMYRNMENGSLIIDVNGERVELSRKQIPPIWRRLLSYNVSRFIDDKFKEAEIKVLNLMENESGLRMARLDDEDFRAALEKTGLSYEQIRNYETGRWDQLACEPTQLLDFLQLTDKLSYVRQRNFASWLHCRGSITLKIHSPIHAWIAIRLWAIWDKIKLSNTHGDQL
jgi:hypothetical protein